VLVGYNYLYGDAYNMSGNAQGGNDSLTAASLAQDFLYGDAYNMSENAHGGDDTLLGASNPSPNNLAGDAWAMSDHALGGNDTLKGGLALSNILVGDAFDH
jgi:hypothetical protein